MFNFNISIKPFLGLLTRLNKEILTLYNSSFEVEHKEDKTPLTTADKLAHRKIVYFLNQHYPDIPVVSEENEGSIYPDYNNFFLVDPIDGTQEFVNKTDEFCICIALIKNKRPIFGIISSVVSGEIFYAYKGKGSFLFADNKFTKINQISYENNILVSRSHLDNKVLSYIKNKFPQSKIVQKGSALKFCDVAIGKANTTLRFGPTYLWDTAAADIILEETNNQLVDITTKKKLQYSTSKLLNPGYIVEKQPLCKICDNNTEMITNKKIKNIYHKCLNCGFVSLDSIFLVDRVQEQKHYEKHENSFEDLGYTDMFVKFVDIAVKPFLTTHKYALEFGCGFAPVLAKILEQQNLIVEKYDYYFEANEKYKNKKYDIITSTEVFEHLETPLQILLDLKKLLNKDGYIILMTKLVDYSNVEFLKWWYIRDITHISFFTSKSFQIMAEKIGLKFVQSINDNIVVFKND